MRGSVKEESGRVVRAFLPHRRPLPRGLTNYGKNLDLALQWVGSKAVLSGTGVSRENLGVVCRECPAGGKIGQTQEEGAREEREHALVSPSKTVSSAQYVPYSGQFLC